MLDSHPKIAGKLLSSIPRLEQVAAMVAGQRDRIGPSEAPDDLRDWDRAELGAQILRAGIELDRLLSSSHRLDREDAFEQLRQHDVPPRLIEALEQVPNAAQTMVRKSVCVSEVRVAMVLDADVMTCSGMRLIPKGQEVTQPILARLRNFADRAGVVEPLRVLISA